MNDDLTDDHRAILDFEKNWWKFPGAKEDEIRRRFEHLPDALLPAFAGVD